MFYDKVTHVFEFGEVPEKQREKQTETDLHSCKYVVSQAMDSLKLKLHGENYFSSGEKEVRERINYGKLMHEIFEGIKTASDISGSVRKLVLEGKLTEAESADLEKRVE
jgi:ATP-dependent helicase/nuclease subunit A